MKNNLSIKSYVEQKPDKHLCNQIAKSICKAVVHDWNNGKFTSNNIDSIFGQSQNEDSKKCKGHTISFRLHNYTEAISKDDVEHEKFDIDYLHNCLNLHNQSWSLVEECFFNQLAKYLNLSGVTVFSYYMKNNPLSDYCYTNVQEYLKENKKLSDEGKDPVSKVQIGISQLIAPESYEGSQPTIALNLLISTDTEIKQFLDQQKESEKD